MHLRGHLLGKSLWPALVVLLALSGVAQAQNELDGTWRLVMRKLADGTTQVPPAVLGLGTNHNGLTNLNVFWHTPEGKPAFFARISTYKISDTEYTETLLFSVFADGSGKPPEYNLKGGT